MNRKKIITFSALISVISISLITYYLFRIEKIKIGESIHLTGKSERLQEISIEEKNPIPENENNIDSIRGEVVDYEPDQYITINYFEKTVNIQIQPGYTLYYEIYSDPRKNRGFESSFENFEEDFSQYIKIGKYVTVMLKEQLREDSILVAEKIFIWEPEK